MKKFFVALVIGFSVMTLSLDASAARLGGGSSFGRSMSLPKAPGGSFKAPAHKPSVNQARPAAGAAAANASRGMGLGKSLLIGAASALGIMALANMLGLGEGFAQTLMILVLLALAFVAFKFFMQERPEQQVRMAAVPIRPRSPSLVRIRFRQTVLRGMPNKPTTPVTSDRVLSWISLQKPVLSLMQVLPLSRFRKTSIRNNSLTCPLLTSRCFKRPGTAVIWTA